MSGEGGYLYKRGSTYWGRIRINGREHRDTLRTDDLREAKKRLKTWRIKVERDEVAGSKSPRWEEAVVKWATEVLPHSVKPSVARRYKTSIIPLTQTFQKMPVAKINSAAIADYVSSRSGFVKNATIRRDLTALSRLLAACQSWGWIDSNPAHLYDRSVVLRERREPIEPPHPDDFEFALQHVPPTMAPILRLLDQTGMRQAEAVSLSGRAIDWKRHTITLIHTKTSRPRVIDWETPGGNAALILNGLPMSGALFPSSDGVPYNNFASTFGAVMRRIVAKAKARKRPFRRFRVHDLRHGFAIRWLQAGGDIYTLSRHLGHTSVKTTEIYLAFLSGQDFTQTGAQRDFDKLKKSKK